ncbi:hypothetical protein NE619_04885 [Anaerovorax odorimutans]|uniref:Uncharacterized protein n=1 Tax=Anaerovorax odorimutans TaxID=109327 RepID=A0ABT1RLK7_9FIRM|nr:hypothetical protein [Anaerovorax odorimutans]MCQ4636053.1 hypothetical protein [Anaerovorax odorimutans]
MVKKIGKKKLLTLLTVAAVVVTMAGSYAAWDQLKVDGFGTLNFDKPVAATMTVPDFTKSSSSGLSENAPVYTSAAVYKVENVPTGVTPKVAITPSVKDGQNPVDSSNFTIAISKGAAELTAAGGVYTDANVSTGENTYTVTITPKDSDAAKALAGKDLTVTLSAELTDAASATPTN